MITEDSSQDKGHSESPTLPPNTGDTDLDEILESLVNAAYQDARHDQDYNERATTKAKAAIEQKLIDNRIDELEKQLLLTGHSALTRRNMHDRIKALQANKEKL